MGRAGGGAGDGGRSDELNRGYLPFDFISRWVVSSLAHFDSVGLLGRQRFYHASAKFHYFENAQSA
jgi:hypothetical protein